MDYLVYTNRRKISFGEDVSGSFKKVRRFETEAEGFPVQVVSFELPDQQRRIRIGFVKFEELKDSPKLNWIRPLTATQRAFKPKASFIDAVVDNADVLSELSSSETERMLVRSIWLEEREGRSEILLASPDRCSVFDFYKRFNRKYEDVEVGICSLELTSVDIDRKVDRGSNLVGVLVEIYRMFDLSDQPFAMLVDVDGGNRPDCSVLSNFNTFVALSSFLEHNRLVTGKVESGPLAQRVQEQKTELLEEEIKKKLAIDFRYSLIGGGPVSQSFIGKTRKYLSRPVNLATTYDNRISGQGYGYFKDVNQGVLKQELPKVRICCSCIYPAALAVLISLQEKLHDRVFIELDWSNSIELIEALGRGQEFDFVVAAEDPFMTVGTGRAFDYAKLTELQFSPQYLLVKSDVLEKDPRQIFIVQGSSAVNQFWSLRQEHGMNSDGKFLETAKHLSKHAQALDDEQGIIAWAPLAESIAEQFDLKTKPGWGYDIIVSLWCHKNEWDKGVASRKLAEEFKGAFVAEWASLVGNVDRAYEILMRNKNFITAFSSFLQTS